MAPGIWGHVADVMAWILKYHGINDLLKWVDNFIFFQYPKFKNTDGTHAYSYNESLVWDTAREIGWPWAPKKCLPFASSFMYIGFLWKIEFKTVELPKEKKLKYTLKIAQWITNEMKTASNAKNLMGTLNHVCIVVPEG